MNDIDLWQDIQDYKNNNNTNNKIYKELLKLYDVLYIGNTELSLKEINFIYDNYNDIYKYIVRKNYSFKKSIKLLKKENNNV